MITPSISTNLYQSQAPNRARSRGSVQAFEQFCRSQSWVAEVLAVVLGVVPHHR
jgi:hypothetical protein